jgi:hypothetical protein
LAPSKDDIGAKGVKPCHKFDVAALFTLSKWRAKSAPDFGRIAALLDGFRDVRFKLFIDLPTQPVSSKCVFDA